MRIFIAHDVFMGTMYDKRTSISFTIFSEFYICPWSVQWDPLQTDFSSGFCDREWC